VNFPLLFSTITAFIIGQSFAILSFFRQMFEKCLKHCLLVAVYPLRKESRFSDGIHRKTGKNRQKN